MTISVAVWRFFAGLGAHSYALLLLLVCAALPVRFGVPGLGRSISIFDLAVAVLFVPWLLLVRRQGWPRVPRPYLVLGLSMLVLGVASLLWTLDRGDTLVHIVVSIESLLVFGYAVTFLRSVRDRSWHRWAQLLLVLLIVPGVLLWLHVPGFQPPSEVVPRSGDYWSYYVRLSHPWIGRSNNLATLLVLLLVPLASWAMRTRKAWDIGCALAAAVALVLTFSRGVLVALVLVTAVYLLTTKAWRRGVLRALRWLVPVVVLAGVVTAVNPTMGRLVLARLSMANVDARFDLLAGFWAELGRGWLLGAGAGTGVDVHNTYAQQVLAFGVPAGLALSAVLVWTGLWWVRRNPSTRPVLQRIVGVGVAAVLLSFAVESSFEGNLLRPLIWLVWGMLVALVLRTSQRVVPAAGARTDSAAGTPVPAARA